MKFTDRVLQRWRIAKASPYISNGARVLDIGCADGALFRHFKSRIGDGVGIDPDLNQSIDMGHCRLIAGWFPQDLPDSRPFDVITLLAVVEHVPSQHLPQMAQDCARFLQVGGSLVITAPAPAVDKILDWLKLMRVIDGMSLEEHHHFDPLRIPSIFAVGGLTLVKAQKFQLGLNNLFVFQKTGIKDSPNLG
jgi:2-polyprenyl-3-methyl-5-hydroxy-6-metoxy-1,4-benzoquinol methylase